MYLGIPGIPDEDSGEDKTASNVDQDPDKSSISPGHGPSDFDEKAVQRAAIVIGALGFMMLIYFGIKFVV